MLIVAKKTKAKPAVDLPNEDGPNHIGGHYSARLHHAVKRLQLELRMNMKNLILMLLLEKLAKHKIPIED